MVEHNYKGIVEPHTSPILTSQEFKAMLGKIVGSDDVQEFLNEISDEPSDENILAIYQGEATHDLRGQPLAQPEFLYQIAIYPTILERQLPPTLGGFKLLGSHKLLGNLAETQRFLQQI
jgi:hypothetical protein